MHANKVIELFNGTPLKYTVCVCMPLQLFFNCCRFRHLYTVNFIRTKLPLYWRLEKATNNNMSSSRGLQKRLNFFFVGKYLRLFKTNLFRFLTPWCRHIYYFSGSMVRHDKAPTNYMSFARVFVQQTTYESTLQYSACWSQIVRTHYVSFFLQLYSTAVISSHSQYEISLLGYTHRMSTLGWQQNQ